MKTLLKERIEPNRIKPNLTPEQRQRNWNRIIKIRLRGTHEENANKLIVTGK